MISLLPYSAENSDGGLEACIGRHLEGVLGEWGLASLRTCHGTRFWGNDQGNLGDPYERPTRDFTRVSMRITKSVHIFTLPLSQYP